MVLKLQPTFDPQSCSNTSVLSLYQLQEYIETVEAQLATTRTVRSQYSSMVRNLQSTTPHHLAIDDTQDTCDQEILDDDAQMSSLLLELTDSLN
jgi:hypothetical protein